MIRTNLVIIMTAIMMTGVAGLSFDVLPVADAAKGKGVPLPDVGSNSGICGLMLCSDYPGGKEAYQMQWSSQFMNMKSVIVESHQDRSETKSISVSAHNVDEEFPAQLDATSGSGAPHSRSRARSARCRARCGVISGTAIRSATGR